jgi:SAM-dependent methyltransferase
MTAASAQSSVIWHDVECSAYAADLPLWEELAEQCDGPVLELGCGTGRVALHLTRRGHRVAGIDSDEALVEELRRRASREELDLLAVHGDATEHCLEQRFTLILAPMQLIQLLPGERARLACLRTAAAQLEPGGRIALAIAEGIETGISPLPQIPDVREVEGRVYSSLPLGVTREGDALVVERLRQTVSGEGTLSEARSETRLRVLSAEDLEGEGAAAGLRAAGRRRIDATDAHIGSTVVLLEA